MAETCRKFTDLTVEHIKTLRLRDFMMLVVSFVSNLFVVYVLLRCIWEFTPLPQWFTGRYGAWIAAACFIAFPCILSRTRIAQLFTLWSIDARKANNEEYEYIKDILLPICEKENKTLDDYEIYIQDTKFMNAYAYGKRFIIITMGMLKSLPKEEITGILAHEAGHIHYGDTRMTQLTNSMEFCGNAAVKVLCVFNHICGLFTFIPCINFIAMVFSWMFSLMIFGIEFFIHTPCTLIKLFFFRQDEYDADRYACELGFADEIYKGLSHICEDDKDMSFLQHIWDTHPKLENRLERIRGFM